MPLFTPSVVHNPRETPQRMQNAIVPIPAHRALYFFCLVATMGLTGCLMYETVDYRIHLNPDGKGGTITITYKNIESTSDEPSKQQEDFQELLDKWKGDGYLLERMNEGVYIKQRELKLVKGILVWKEAGIFSDVQKMKDGISYSDTSRIAMGKDETVLSTNGMLVMSKDSVAVVWPPHTRDFHLIVQNRDFKPTSHFSERFRKLKAM